MAHLPYIRLRPEDLPGTRAIWGWADAAPELVSAIGLSTTRRIPIPLAGRRGEGERAVRRQAREGLVTLLALEPSHPDRTLYVEVLRRCFPGFERWLGRRISRAFASGRHQSALREAVVAVNLKPGAAEARFNLGLLLTRMISRDPAASNARRWSALAQAEFQRAAELSPDLFWAHYHRGVLAYEASLQDAACVDWMRFLDRFFADKAAPRAAGLPLLPLDACRESAELPGLAYAVLLDLLSLRLPRPSVSSVSG